MTVNDVIDLVCQSSRAGNRAMIGQLAASFLYVWLLEEFVKSDLDRSDLFESIEAENRIKVLHECIAELESALNITGKPDPWGSEIKVTDDFLDPLFRRFYQRLGVPQKTFKRDYHGLADAIPIDSIKPEVFSILDSLYDVARLATPSN